MHHKSFCIECIDRYRRNGAGFDMDLCVFLVLAAIARGDCHWRHFVVQDFMSDLIASRSKVAVAATHALAADARALHAE